VAYESKIGCVHNQNLSQIVFGMRNRGKWMRDTSDNVQVKDVRFEVFTEMTMKNCVYLDVTTCGSY
jgi:hypothetical protein